MIGSFGPTSPQGGSRIVAAGVVEVRNESDLAERVRAWANQEFPGELSMAERAAVIAKAAYTGGASVSESFWKARSFVGSWTRHPAHRRVRQDMVRLAP